MYAIMQSGSKQYRVEEGDIIDVELLEAKAGEPHVFKEVLFVQDASKSQVGLPFVEGCVVQGEILGEAKGPKVIAFKIKRRKNCRKKIGHRQKYARVRITAIGAADKKPTVAATPKKKAAEPKVEVKTEVKAKAKTTTKPAEKKAAPKKAEAKKEAPKKTAPKAVAKKPAAKKKKES